MIMLLEQAHAKQQKRQILARQEDAQPGGSYAPPPRARSAGKKAGSLEVSEQVLAMSLTDVEGTKIVRPR